LSDLSAGVTRPPPLIIDKLTLIGGRRAGLWHPSRAARLQRLISHATATTTSTTCGRDVPTFSGRAKAAVQNRGPARVSKAEDTENSNPKDGRHRSL